MYKDRDKQREAVREATRRWRVSQGITKKVSQKEGITVIPVTPIMKTKEDAVRAARTLSPPAWRVPKVAECRRFSDEAEG